MPCAEHYPGTFRAEGAEACTHARGRCLRLPQPPWVTLLRGCNDFELPRAKDRVFRGSEGPQAEGPTVGGGLFFAVWTALSGRRWAVQR